MKYLWVLISSALALRMTQIELKEDKKIIWETPKYVNAITQKDEQHYSLNLTYYNQIITNEYGEVNMWANLTAYDGPLPSDGTYFFSYM